MRVTLALKEVCFMCADKKMVVEFFDGLAARWDAENPLDPEIVEKILDLSDIRSGLNVLDVACGTGLLIPCLLDRNVASVTGVDISGAMLAEAKKKFAGNKKVHLIRADFQACQFDTPYDRCIVYDALPHFPDHAQFLRRVAGAVKPGGRLTVAQGESMETVEAKLKAMAPDLVTELPSAKELAELLQPWFVIDVCISDQEKYVVSGVRTDMPTRAVFFTKDRR